MKFYIGNPTAQDREFNCRPAEFTRNLSILVPAGRQRLLGDFTDQEAASIRHQMEPYGLRTVDEAMRADVSTHYLYCTVHHISAAQLLKVYENNKELARNRGALMRKAMAVRAGQEVDNKLIEQGDAITRALEISLEEERRGETRDGQGISDEPSLGEGFRFEKRDQPPQPPNRNRRRGGQRAAA